MPGEQRSVAVLCVGTAGFGSDAYILSRPGHRRRLQALSRIHKGKLWVKPDFLDLNSRVPDSITNEWPDIEAAIKKYNTVIYAACAVTDKTSPEIFEDLLDLFFFERANCLKADAKRRWATRLTEIRENLFESLNEEQVTKILKERRFVILQGPPGTGKTRLARRIAKHVGSSTQIQFHPARTYEDFVIGLAPQTKSDQLAFTVRPGDLLRANDAAQANGDHVLFIDEINRADLTKVLGEAIYLFEPTEPDRDIDLPHEHNGKRQLQLAPGLTVLGTLNTADRSIARMDLAIRRRFAFIDVWPDLEVVGQQGDELAQTCFEDTLHVFTEHTDDAGLGLTPGHAYFLDPRPDMPEADRPGRIRRRLKYELVPLLRAYVEERLTGPATAEVEGLADRIEAKLREAETAA